MSAFSMTPGSLAGAAGALALLGVTAHHTLDYLKGRFTALNKPSWEMQGQARMYGDQGGTVRYVKGQESLVKGMFEIPYDIVKTRATAIADSFLDQPGKTYDKYRVAEAFEKIRNDPSVQAMGVAQARDMFMDIGKLAPDVVRKAPGTVVPAIQNAIMTDSTGLRPDYIQAITRAQSYM